MATSTFGKQFEVRHEKAADLVKEMSISGSHAETGLSFQYGVFASKS